jgi:hypothetical protein
MTREQMAALVADAIADQFEVFMSRVRAEVFERMHDMELRARTPSFQLTPMGELYCNGERIGDVRPIFKRVVHEALDIAQPKPAEAEHDGDG